MKKGHSEFLKVPVYYLILDKLEKIKDELTWLIPEIIPSTNKNTELKNKNSLEDINLCMRTAYDLFYKFEPQKYGKYQHKTFILKNQHKMNDPIEKVDMHLHNIARLLNSLYADIFCLKYDQKNK